MISLGSQLYVTAEGQLQVSQDSRNLGILKPGIAFGELAMLYNCKRTASVRGNSNVMSIYVYIQVTQCI